MRLFASVDSNRSVCRSLSFYVRMMFLGDSDQQRYPETLRRQAEEKFKELAEAYATLSNGEKRKQYDMESRINSSDLRVDTVYIYIILYHHISHHKYENRERE